MTSSKIDTAWTKYQSWHSVCIVLKYYIIIYFYYILLSKYFIHVISSIFKHFWLKCSLEKSAKVTRYFAIITGLAAVFKFLTLLCLFVNKQTIYNSLLRIKIGLWLWQYRHSCCGKDLRDNLLIHFWSLAPWLQL